MKKSFPLLILCIFAMLLAVPGSWAGGQDKQPALDAAGIDRLVADTHAEVTLHPATGAARFVRIPAGDPKAAQSFAAGSPKDTSLAFFRNYGSVFGIKNPDTELTLVKTQTEVNGATHLTYNQVYNGLPVFAAVLKTHFDTAGRLTVVNGTFIPGLSMSPLPKQTAASAASVAVVAVNKERNASAGLSVISQRLLIYRLGLAQGVPGDGYLAYEVEVGNGKDIREFVYVDANNNRVLDRIAGIQDAAAVNRRSYDGKNLGSVPPEYPASPIWLEGDPFPTTFSCVAAPSPYSCNTEADNMLYASIETWQLFYNTFARDSFDNAGHVYDSIFDRGYSCPNASWNGTFISFCPGTTTDDVTGHELGHAYTTYTDGLIYAWQPGALNESYSDIVGETLDQINGRQTDTPANPRTGLCSAFSPARAELVVNTPAGIAGNYVAQSATFGPALTGVGVTAAVATTTPIDGCTAIAEDLTGKIAIIDRGTCNFTVKVKNAQLKGAIGVIIANNASTGLPGMGGSDGTITIPSLGVTQAAGNSIRSQIPSPGVNATLHSTAGATDNSVLWLMGEDAGAFNGAIRDMSNPTCYSNPGKVSDVAFYVCATTDNGGVHTNSGVSNHAYQLMVDGGTYNGQTITGMGLLKAFSIYYRAKTVYQVPDTDFTAHADALEQACSDLTGMGELTGFDGNPSGQFVTASDCTQVHKVTLAVELRVPPSFCGFQPMLAKTPPPVCGTGGTATNIYSFDFETDPFGAEGWTVEHTGVFPSFDARDWYWTNAIALTPPTGGTGDAAFGWDYPYGDCAADDQSGVIRMITPTINLPANTLPIVSFDHWMASELGWDGGNINVSTDGGTTWTLVPSSAFKYNAYNATMQTSGAGNTSPLAGQAGYTGADGGSVDGSWGKSIIDLSSLVLPGQSFQLRFNFGQDGCGSNYGWFVDNFSVDTCVPTISINDVTSTEGNSGNKNFNFTVSLSAPSGNTVTVNYATANGTATGSDYISVPFGVLSFAPGTTSKTVAISVTGDTTYENDETFFVNLSGAVNANISDNQGLGTITNDDTLPTLSINDVSQAEGNSGSANMTFTVTLSAASALTTTVNYGTSSGTATSGSDFTATSGTLTFTAGQTTKNVLVPILGDTTYEPNETFKVSLNSPTNATLLYSEGQGTITNDDSCPTITPNDTLADGVVGTVYSGSIVAGGGVAPYIYILSGGALPTGLILNPNGTVSGTPTVAGTFTFNVVATDANQCTGIRSYSVTVTCPTITLDDTLADGVVGTAYTGTVAASGGNSPYTYAVTSGTFPTGLTLNSDGTITGTPTAAGDYTFTVTATDQYGCTGANSSYSVTIDCPSIVLDDTLPDGQAGASYSGTVIASGGNPTYVYSLTGGALPAGLTLNANGTITGTPTESGDFTFTVTATDAYGCTGINSSYSITISCPTITLDDTLADGTVGVAYTGQSITASGGTAPYTYAVTAGTFPTGLTLNSDGTISGTPTAVGTFTFTVTATDDDGCTGENTSYSVSIGCLFCDDFNDNNFTTGSGSWTMSPAASYSAATGDAVGTTTKKADLTSPDFGGCTNCTFESNMSVNSPGGRMSMFAWSQDSKHWVEVRLAHDKQIIFVKQSDGSNSAKAKIDFPVNLGQVYDVAITFSGGQFTVTVDGTPEPGLTFNAIATPDGNVKFRVKSTTGASTSGTVADVTVF